jgi:hypothetical protein
MVLKGEFAGTSTTLGASASTVTGTRSVAGL